MKIPSLHSCCAHLKKSNYFIKVLVLYCVSYSGAYATDRTELEINLPNNFNKVTLFKGIDEIGTSPDHPVFFTVDSQQNTVNGIVTDQDGQAVLGATIVVVGKEERGVTTDFDGKFTLTVSAGDEIKISYVGMKTVTITYIGQKELRVQLEPDVSELEDVTVVAFSKQKKESVIGAITAIKPTELRVPSSNLTTSFAGRIPGLIAYQRSGEPGRNTAEFFIRGITTFGYRQGPLILIDNNEVTTEQLSRIHPDDIASFSIMKDATATSLYGSRGANGVVLITTKEGKEGKAQISVRVEQSISSPTDMVELADPITYMELHNEAVRTRNPLLGVPYSPQKIANTKAGGNPYVYPTNDWHNLLFKDHSLNKRVNLNASGGGKAAQYYIAGSFSSDNGMLNVDKKNNFNNNIELNRYMLRSNVNINITNSTRVTVRLQGAFDDYSGPIDSGGDLFNKVIRSNPVLFPATFEPDAANVKTQHILFGNALNASGDIAYNNPYADMTKGYREYAISQISAQFELKQDLSFITEGLSVRGLFNTNRYSRFDVNRFYNPFFYGVSEYNKNTNEYVLESFNENSGTEYLGYNEGNKDINSTVYLESAINWDRTFNEKHTVSGLLVANMREQVFANAGDLQRSLPYRNLGYAGRATYAYDSRYLMEFNFGYNGSERFAKKERFGFFPSAGLGWIVSNEKFWQGKIKNTINKLKLRLTYGIVGNDAIGSADDRFFYLSNVNLNSNGNGAGFGTFGNTYSRPGVSISRYPNLDITWETSTKYNLGFEIGLWNKLDIQADIFTDYRENILMTRADIPSTLGLQSQIRANVGEASSKGVEVALNFNHSFGETWLIAMGNFTFATNRFEVYEEAIPDNAPWRSRVGQSLAQHYGYIAERLFVDEAEVKNSPQQFGEYGAGDIKFKDINKDGVINELDIVPIGHPHSPEIVYGFGFSAGWKGLDFSSFFQGVARTSVYLNASATSPFIDGQNALLKAYADDHWSEDNRNVYALWPRLSEYRVANNMLGSTWVLRNAAFLRLKSAEIGYSFPDKFISRASLTKLRAYVSGLNLATFSVFKLWDPEMGGNGLGYPIQKMVNFGLQLSF